MRSFHMTASNTLMLSSAGHEHLTGGATLTALTQQLAYALAVALAAVLVNIATLMRGSQDGQLILTDFRLALVSATVVGVLAAWVYRRLPHDSGADVSGYVSATAPRS
jgi:hypothetical protein